MRNKQTAVEWVVQESFKLNISLEKNEITIGEFAVKHKEIYDKAKQMEVDQHRYTWQASYWAKELGKPDFETYYQNTFIRKVDN